VSDELAEHAIAADDNDNGPCLVWARGAYGPHNGRQAFCSVDGYGISTDGERTVMGNRVVKVAEDGECV